MSYNEADQPGEGEYPDPEDLQDADDRDDLVACAGCGQMIYEDAPRCPHCGAWVEADSPAARRGKGWLWPIVIALLVVLLAMGWRMLRL